MNVFILESKEDVLKYKNQIKGKLDYTIISSSIQSHQLLNDKNIDHEIVDDYFIESDYDKINLIATDFALNWYKQKGVELDFDNLNMGYLLEQEIEHFFLKYVRQFFCLKTIITKKNPKKIFVGTLYPMIKEIVGEMNIEVIHWEIKNEVILDMDKVEIPLPFSKSGGLKISRNRYFEIKNIIEKLVISNSKISNNSKSILLLDFNPIYFRSLFEELSENFENIFLLNQRRPAIWNLESLKIVKSSNCNVVRLDDFSDKKIKEEISNNQKKFSKRIELLENNSSLNEYFKIEKYCLWEIIKEKLIPILKKQSNEMIYRIFMIERVLNKIEFSCVLEWAYTGFEERIVNHLVEKQKIPIVFLQHSAQPENSKWDTFLPFQPILPQKEDKIAAYGNNISNYLIKKNIPEKNILLTGSPRHDLFFNAKNDIKKENTIVVATTSSSSMYTADGVDIKSYNKWEKTMQKLIFEIKKYTDKKLIIKLHPSKEVYDIRSFIERENNNIKIYKDQKSIDFLKNCDVLIVTNFSTILHEAMILQKPTMMISTQNLNWDEEPIVKNKATIFISDIIDIEKNLEKIIRNKEFRNNLIQNANNYIDQYFINQGNASKYLAKKLVEIK